MKTNKDSYEDSVYDLNYKELYSKSWLRFPGEMKKTFDSGVLGTRNKNERLHDNPHYTEEEFKHPQTIFGSKSQCLHYVYSDRIWQADYKKSQQAAAKANASGADLHTCRWYEVYLSEFFGKKIVIDHIMAGCNLSSGISYLVFGYRELP